MKNIKLLLLTLLFCGFSYAQVGIGTTTPDPSSMLDVTSDSQGLLVPRMTTAERNAITDPAKSLLVFDTTENTYYFNEGDDVTPNWIPFLSDNERRDNYVLVKSVDDFPAPTSGTITLDENTLYEINGTITLSNPIELNDAQLLGRDAGEDVLSKASGAVFTGTTGGNIKNLTIEGGGTVFAITGGTSLLFQNCIVSGMASVGTISGVGLYFSNIVNFVGNTTGVTYTNIGNLLLNNQGWASTNAGTYETFTGTFGLIEKVSGFSTVASGNTGIDVSSSPTVGTGVLQGTVFSGGGDYVNGYNPEPYDGYNFSNSWTVNAPGIPRESDDVAGGNFYSNAGLTTGFTQDINNGNAVKVLGNGTTIANSLFRFTAPGNNRLTYEGTKTRNFQINASLSIRVTGAADDFYAFLIAKNGNIVTESNAIVRINDNTEIQNVSINAIVSLTSGDYIEIYTQRFNGSGTDTLVVFSENLSIN
ncbi:MAG: hypothetical protein CMC07_04945 [Flavobacteriaceae bacterium]|nr:hypothetical protein [Flavobacteriaceae bacterium]|tara:strand:+ start:3148 stop:4572 length:1425 start_codon:yes stop_codon:yes gene_type:complete